MESNPQLQQNSPQKKNLNLLTEVVEHPAQQQNLKEPQQNIQDLLIDLKQSPLCRMDDDYRQIFDNPIFLYQQSPEFSPILPSSDPMPDNLNSPLYLDINQFNQPYGNSLSSTRQKRPSIFFKQQKQQQQQQQQQQSILSHLGNKQSKFRQNNGVKIEAEGEVDIDQEKGCDSQQQKFQIQKNHLFPFVEDEISEYNNSKNTAKCLNGKVNQTQQQQQGIQSDKAKQQQNQYQQMGNQNVTLINQYDLGQPQIQDSSQKMKGQQDTKNGNNINIVNYNINMYQNQQQQLAQNNNNLNFQNQQIVEENNFCDFNKEQDLQQSFDRLRLKEEYQNQDHNDMYSMDILQSGTVNNPFNLGSISVQQELQSIGKHQINSQFKYQTKQEEPYEEYDQMGQSNPQNMKLNVSFYEPETHKKHKMLNSPLVPLDKRIFDYKSDIYQNSPIKACSSQFNFNSVSEQTHSIGMKYDNTLTKSNSDHHSQSTYVMDSNSSSQPNYEEQLNNIDHTLFNDFENEVEGQKKSRFYNHSHNFDSGDLSSKKRDRKGNEKKKCNKEKQPATQEKLIKKARNNGVYTFWKSYLEFITCPEFLAKPGDVVYQFMLTELNEILKEYQGCEATMELFQSRLKVHYEKEKKMSAQTLSELLNLEDKTVDSQNRMLEIWEKRLIKVSFKEWLKTDYPEKYIEASLKKTKGNGSDQYSKNIRQIGWNQALSQMRKSSNTDFRSMTREFNKNQFKNNLDSCSF